MGKRNDGTALLVVDAQVAIVSGGEGVEPAYREQETLVNIGELLEKARAAGAPVVYVQHEHARWAPLRPGAEGWQIHPAIAPRPGDPIVHKRASDSFYGTPLRSELDRLGITRLVICGLESEKCVDATARRALSLDYDVVLAADAHSTHDGEVLPADRIVAHTNVTLADLPHPTHEIAVMPTAEIAF
jgi:nicotinamidase-related amidase